MPNATKQSELETARARLETALSALTHGVANSKSALDAASADSQEKTALANRIGSLEVENLKLHEQVAAYALQPEPAVDDAQLAAATEEIAQLKRVIEKMEQDKSAIRSELDAAIAEMETMLEDA